MVRGGVGVVRGVGGGGGGGGGVVVRGVVVVGKKGRWKMVST